MGPFGVNIKVNPIRCSSHFAAGATEALGTALGAATSSTADAAAGTAVSDATGTAVVSATTADEAAGAGASVDAQAMKEHAITNNDNLVILESLL